MGGSQGTFVTRENIFMATPIAMSNTHSLAPRFFQLPHGSIVSLKSDQVPSAVTTTVSAADSSAPPAPLAAQPWFWFPLAQPLLRAPLRAL